MIERKCLNCGTWNKDESHCTACAEPVSHEAQFKVEIEKKRIEAANKPKDKFDLFAEKLKNHDSVFFRIIYKIGYSIGMVFAAIGGFFAWLVAMANG